MAQFKLDDDERKLFHEWYNKHLIDEHHGTQPYAGAVGGSVQYEVIHTAIGMITHAVCLFCKVQNKDKEVYSIDLTDYDSW